MDGILESGDGWHGHQLASGPERRARSGAR
jgi:hypothetical protein